MLDYLVILALCFLVAFIGAVIGSLLDRDVKPFRRGFEQQADATRYLAILARISEYPVDSPEGKSVLAVLCSRMGISPADVLARLERMPVRDRASWHKVLPRVLR
jgi:hypothetical protein